MLLIDRVKEWKQSTGKSAYLKILTKAPFNQNTAILAKCAECCNGYSGGRVDCGIVACPLYSYMPYRNKP